MSLPSELNIRFANEADAPIISRIHTASWQKIYRGQIPDYILDNLSTDESVQNWRTIIKAGVKVLLIEKNNEIAGFASLCASRDADTNPIKCGEISAIYLHPDYLHQGLGTILCNRALTELSEMGFSEVIVWVLLENMMARKFYESLGFINTNFVKTDESGIFDEVRYCKDITL